MKNRPKTKRKKNIATSSTAAFAKKILKQIMYKLVQIQKEIHQHIL